MVAVGDAQIADASRTLVHRRDVLSECGVEIRRPVTPQHPRTHPASAAEVQESVGAAGDVHERAGDVERLHCALGSWARGGLT